MGNTTEWTNTQISEWIHLVLVVSKKGDFSPKHEPHLSAWPGYSIIMEIRKTEGPFILKYLQLELSCHILAFTGFVLK